MRVEPVVQARMLNKFVFCARRGYLEYVHGEWSENELTLEGGWVHRRVDAREQGLGRPDAAPPFEVRSVELTSERLGLTGKLDLVLGEGDEAVPVEYKKGRPPKDGSLPYPSDQAQLCAQALLLLDNGWTVERGFLYYAETREKRELMFSESLLNWGLQQLENFRQVTTQSTAPAPLVGSPKCQFCSLVEICLPDEVLQISSGQVSSPQRQLLAPVDQSLPIYITQNGSSIGLSGECLEARYQGKTLASFRLIDVSQVCLFGNVQVSTQAIREMASRQIPVCYFSHGGWFQAMTMGLSHRNVELRRNQFRRAGQEDFCLQLARNWVGSKILNCRTLLRRNSNSARSLLSELKRLVELVEKTNKIESLLGVEGLAARLYFQAFPAMLKTQESWPKEFQSEGRRRRPPPDPINAVLSYLYSLLTKELTVQTQAIGLDPYQGFYHQNRYGKPSFALDLMEEFRPLIADSVAVTLINTQVLRESDFRRFGGSVVLSANGRRKVIEAYERRLQQEVKHPWFDYRLSYRRILYVQTRLVARMLLGELESIPRFTTR